MVTVRALLARGNSKLGSAIHHFDLPAVRTCPGRSSVCEAVCYATRNRFRTDPVRERLHWCLRRSRRADFADHVVDEVRQKGALVVRLHVSGDFYDAEYAQKWLSAIRRCRATAFYFYTRSWRVAEIEPVLAELAALENVVGWYSADADTGVPECVPPGVRIAWLQGDADEPVAGDLVFRDRPLRAVPPPKVALPLVCPSETPAGRRANTNCGNCGHCWKR
jgi:hypothetical protein